MIFKDGDEEWDGEVCERPACKGAKVVWYWDRSKPGVWGEKRCENCKFRYSGIFCPYIPLDVVTQPPVSKIPDPTWTHSATVLSDGSIERHSDYKE